MAAAAAAAAAAALGVAGVCGRATSGGVLLGPGGGTRITPPAGALGSKDLALGLNVNSLALGFKVLLILTGAGVAVAPDVGGAEAAAAPAVEVLDASSSEEAFAEADATGIIFFSGSSEGAAAFLPDGDDEEA